MPSPPSLAAGPPIHHFDLYRLTQQYDLARLDLRASFTQAVCLVEWPERLGAQQQPADHLAVHISILEQAEQRRMQQQRQGLEGQGRQQQEQQAAGSPGGTSSSSGGEGRGDEDEDEDGDEEGSGDARWRRIKLSSASQRWQPRLQLLRRYLEAEGAELGCYLLPDSRGGAV